MSLFQEQPSQAPEIVQNTLVFLNMEMQLVHLEQYYAQGLLTPVRACGDSFLEITLDLGDRFVDSSDKQYQKLLCALDRIERSGLSLFRHADSLLLNPNYDHE
jgi:hypothetical protein